MSEFSDPDTGRRHWAGLDQAGKLHDKDPQGVVPVMLIEHTKAAPPLRAVSVAHKDRSAAPGRYLFGMLLADIAAGTASLPSPQLNIAKRIRRGIQDARHGRRVARLLAADPALSAKALRIACAAGQLRRPRTLPQVVDRLDRHYIHGLVAAATEAGSPFEHQPALRQVARAAWQRALRVSTISYLLATLDGRFDPEQASLAGLLHNLGELALLGRAARQDRTDIASELADACRYYGAEAGQELARNWGFPASLVRVAGSCGDWYREHDGPADIADLVLVAQLHARLGQNHAESLPSLQRMPAFERLDLGQADPRFSLGLLEAANSALALTQRQLAAL